MVRHKLKKAVVKLSRDKVMKKRVMLLGKSLTHISCECEVYQSLIGRATFPGWLCVNSLHACRIRSIT